VPRSYPYPFGYRNRGCGLAARLSLVALLCVLLSSPLLAAVTTVDAYIQRWGLAEQPDCGKSAS